MPISGPNKAVLVIPSAPSLVPKPKNIYATPFHKPWLRLATITDPEIARKSPQTTPMIAGLIRKIGIWKSVSSATAGMCQSDKGNAEWIEAWEKGDPEMLAAIFTDDAVMLSQGGRVFKGRQQILERQKAAMQSVTRPVKVSVTTVKIWLDGDTAYETGKYKYEYTEKGKPTTEEGRYVTTWKRQSDGSWKLSMDMAVPEK
jgi:uncharacterized protein (TIGR02246 family)